MGPWPSESARESKKGDYPFLGLTAQIALCQHFLLGSEGLPAAQNYVPRVPKLRSDIAVRADKIA